MAVSRGLSCLAPIALMLLFGCSHLVSLANDVGLMVQRHPLVFWPRDELTAIAALRPHSDDGSVVLAGPESSYVIAGLTGRAVILGHDVETLDNEAKRVAVAWFYQAENAVARRAFLDRYRVTHVFSGPREQAVGLDTLSFLTPVYDHGGVKIYRVNGR